MSVKKESSFFLPLCFVQCQNKDKCDLVDLVLVLHIIKFGSFGMNAVEINQDEQVAKMMKEIDWDDEALRLSMEASVVPAGPCLTKLMLHFTGND
ncbi:hypothetical protein L1987_47840 [Smallanthus sonchifolius]|uniref:Uncharacterized protein n=1 Tax=Smallanthus sonchifolius TaxID=185202 RepID=A0ACB9FR67_9ASTR|nr:hypothetical protein L1987_47840 [Smallanthus sonchifolius]